MTTGTWTSGPPLPAGRQGHAVATDGQGRVYAMGGNAPENAIAFDTVYRFDPTVNAWTTVAPLPVTLAYAAGATDGSGRVYLTGGSQVVGNSPIADTVYRYDPTANSWSTMAPLPAARAHHATATDTQGRLYVIGGSYLDAQSSSATNTVYRYDPTTNAWSTMAPLPVTLMDFAAAADLQGRVYVTGGTVVSSSANSLATYRYDPTTNAWTTVTSVPGSRRSVHQSVADLGGLIYVLGGVYAGTTETVYRYDPAVNAWTAVAPLPSGMRSHANAALDGYGHILYIGGSNTGSGGTTVDIGQFNSPPNAPTLTSMTGGVFVPIDVTNRASHQFSDPDPGDSQSSFFLRYRLVGAPSWTTLAEQITPNQFYDFPAGTFALGNYERQVATRDAIGIPTNSVELVWSPSGFFTVGTTPIGPTFTDPTNGQSIFLNAYTATISVPDATQTEWRTVADNAGAPDPGTIYSASVVKVAGVDSDLRSFTFKFPVNNRTEHLQARAFFEGLWSPWADSTNPIAYTQPPVPTVVVTEDPTDGRLLVTITNPAPAAGQPAVAYNDIRADDLDGAGFGYKYDSRMVAANGTWVYWLPRAGIDTGIEVSAVGVNGTRTAVVVGAAPVIPPVDPPPPDPPPAGTYVDNGNGTWSSAPVDNGNGTWTDATTDNGNGTWSTT